MIPQELKNYDAAIFDPPRAGAEAQCAELARSQVKKLVAVSCNPLTLARDLAILVNGGYRITQVTPIDQFSLVAACGSGGASRAVNQAQPPS